MCNIITCIDTYKTSLRAPWAAKLKGCIPWPFCNTKLKQRESTADSPAHRAPIINMLISMFQLLKMILGTTYWIFNLHLSTKLAAMSLCNGAHTSAGEGDACRQQWLRFWWDESSYPRTGLLIGSWELQDQRKANTFPICVHGKQKGYRNSVLKSLLKITPQSESPKPRIRCIFCYIKSSSLFPFLPSFFLSFYLYSFLVLGYRNE